jgi:hypothetical protein
MMVALAKTNAIESISSAIKVAGIRTLLPEMPVAEIAHKNMLSALANVEMP